MKESFILVVDPQTCCVENTLLVTPDGIEWSLTGQLTNDGGLKLTLSRANNTLEKKFYCAQMMTLVKKPEVNAHIGFPFHSARSYTPENDGKMFVQFESENTRGFTFIAKYGSYTRNGIYPDAVRIDLIPITRYNSKPEQPGAKINAEMEINVPNKKVTDFDKLSANMGQLFRDGTMADVVLKTGTCSIKAHKFILAARSPVFQRMFSVEMKESLQNVVKITDISDDVLKVMLSYMYTSEIIFKDMKTTRALYVAADKYDLKDLKAICSSWLRCMTIGSAVDTLILADDHTDQNLKSAALEFIATNYASIKQSPNWQSLLKERLALAIEFLSYKVDSMEG